MRFLLDTNILIPLEDSRAVLEPNLTNFVRLAGQHKHDLLYHPASKRDLGRDADAARRQQTLNRINRYQELLNPPDCPWNTSNTNENDAVDNEILYAIERNAVDALVTEDRGIHTKAKARGLEKRIYYIQTAEQWLLNLHSEKPVSLPNIRVANLHQLDLTSAFFDSLRQNYQGFNAWFAKASREGRKAWIYGDSSNVLEALCIFHVQTNEVITDDNQMLRGDALKLCTFKVGEAVRGKKIGELFLKAAFHYATNNSIENIFITTNPYELHLVDLLTDFGFKARGVHKGDNVYVKAHPKEIPQSEGLETFEFHRRYFPHYLTDVMIQKFVVPIEPKYHKVLFPDYMTPQQKQEQQLQLELFSEENTVGNAIKLAYLSHTQLKAIRRGDIVMFYRSGDLKALTSIGIVEDFVVLENAEEIARVVSRRTVYRFDQIQEMATKPTKVILFRLVKHFSNYIPWQWMKENKVVNGNIQTIRKIDDTAFKKVVSHAE